MKKLVLFAYFRAFYLAKRRHLRASKILVLLAKNHKTKLKIPAFLRGHCALPSLNSSLGNQFAQILVLPASLRRMPNTPHSQGFSVAQSNTANTKIVGGEIQDSKVNSESPLSDSHSISESYPHASLESTQDSEPTSAVGHCPTAIKIKSCVAQTESRQLSGAENRKKGGSSASADLELEADKRGTPLDCRKSGGFFGAKGSGEGINPFLRKRNEEREFEKERWRF